MRVEVAQQYRTHFYTQERVEVAQQYRTHYYTKDRVEIAQQYRTWWYVATDPPEVVYQPPQLMTCM